MSAPYECDAVLSIKGEHFHCDTVGLHERTHGSIAAGAIWMGRSPREHIVSDTEECWCEPIHVKVDGK